MLWLRPCKSRPGTCDCDPRPCPYSGGRKQCRWTGCSCRHQNHHRPRCPPRFGRGLAVAAKLGDKEAREAIERFLAAIKTTTDPNALAALGVGLEAVSRQARRQEAEEAVRPFLAAIKTTIDPNALRALGTGLGAVTSPTRWQSTKAALRVVSTKCWKEHAIRRTFAIYAELSAQLAHSGQGSANKDDFRLLPHPLTAGEPTTRLLVLLERVPGVQTQFGGDLWKAVEWAEVGAEGRAASTASASLLRCRPGEPAVATTLAINSQTEAS